MLVIGTWLACSLGCSDACESEGKSSFAAASSRNEKAWQSADEPDHCQAEALPSVERISSGTPLPDFQPLVVIPFKFLGLTTEWKVGKFSRATRTGLSPPTHRFDQLRI